MSRISSGTLYRQKYTKNWSIKFYIDGKPFRESTQTEDREQALAFLRRRVDEARARVYVAPDERPTLESLHLLLLEDYRFKRNRTHPSRHVRRLIEFFGNCRAEEITEKRIVEYSRKRLDRDGMKAATLRRELALLKRMLRLGADWIRKFVHLRDSKNREPRVFPFKYHPQLEDLLLRQRDRVATWEREHSKLCAWVFHWRGQRIQKLRRSWRRGCLAAGLPTKLVHDFRRTAVRNLIRAGVQQAIAMKVTGHKTDSVFRRYLIVDEELLAQATGAVSDLLSESQLANEKVRSRRAPLRLTLAPAGEPRDP